MKSEIILDLETALNDMNHDMDVYRDVVEVFIETTPGFLTNIAAAWEQNDLEAVNRIAHSIKGSSRSVGGIQLSAIAEQIETQTSSDTTDAIEKLINQLQKSFDILREEINTKLFY